LGRAARALCVTLAAGLTAAGVAAGGSTGVTYRLTAKLNTQQVVPPLKGPLPAGTGTFTATLADRPIRSHVAWTLRFTRLSSRATNTYIYLGKRGTEGRIALIVCGPCQAVARGDSFVKRAVVKALENGGAYIQIETKKHPAGEVRGQISASRG
jgi:hypothetical protein